MIFFLFQDDVAMLPDVQAHDTPQLDFSLTIIKMKRAMEERHQNLKREILQINLGEKLRSYMEEKLVEVHKTMEEGIKEIEETLKKTEKLVPEMDARIYETIMQKLTEEVRETNGLAGDSEAHMNETDTQKSTEDSEVRKADRLAQEMDSEPQRNETIQKSTEKVLKTI